MVQPTSLDAFKSIQPVINKRQQQIVGLMMRHLHRYRNWTNREIADAFGWDACQVTGRMKELREKGIVLYDGERPCTVTGRTVMAWRLSR